MSNNNRKLFGQQWGESVVSGLINWFTSQRQFVESGPDEEPMQQKLDCRRKTECKCSHYNNRSAEIKFFFSISLSLSLLLSHTHTCTHAHPFTHIHTHAHALIHTHSQTHVLISSLRFFPSHFLSFISSSKYFNAYYRPTN